MDSFKLFILNNKKTFFSISCFVLIIIILISTYLVSNENNYSDDDVLLNEEVEEIYTESEFVNEEQEKNIQEFISVDIKGRVRKPGVYQIDKNLDRRVSDVITMAGGLYNDADTTVTNLSKKLFDEMVIIIYSKNEVKEFTEVLKKEEVKNDACQNECDSCIDKEDISTNIKDNQNDNNENNKLININTASKEELMTLTGIGESKALAIIDYRNKTPFEKIEDIMNITGIKESAFEKIKDSITV